MDISWNIKIVKKSGKRKVSVIINTSLTPILWEEGEESSNVYGERESPVSCALKSFFYFKTLVKFFLNVETHVLNSCAVGRLSYFRLKKCIECLGRFLSSELSQGSVDIKSPPAEGLWQVGEGEMIGGRKTQVLKCLCYIFHAGSVSAKDPEAPQQQQVMVQPQEPGYAPEEHPEYPPDYQPRSKCRTFVCPTFLHFQPNSDFFRAPLRYSCNFKVMPHRTEGPFTLTVCI